jgi:PncC family amidohydrolase
MPDQLVSSSPSLEIYVGRLLSAAGLRLAVAESCTGGLISHRLTNVPGSSSYFWGGVVAYDYSAKERLLGVRRETLDAYGAVSEQTVLEMARGVCLALGTDLGLSVSGIAGPGGGTPEKPVGLTWIGVYSSWGEWARKYIWQGDRLAVKEQSSEQALQLLVEFLETVPR